MTQDEVVALARECNMPYYWRTGEITYLDKLVLFAQKVASKEREECAKVADRHSTCANDTPNVIATAISARGAV